MTQIKNHINTYADLTAYNNDLNKDFPNISYIQGDEVKWNKYDPDHIVCVYNVTSTSETTKLLDVDNFITYQIIDGVQQQSVKRTYKFNTLGEHTVKYKLNVRSIANYFYNCQNLISATIPNSITSVDTNAFRNCTRLTSITIPSSVTSLGQSSFYNCVRLTSVTIPSSVTYIGNNTFYGSGLTSITIPSSVTSFGGSTFYDCSNLRFATIQATTPPTLGNTSCFSGSYPIYVPAESVNAYKAASGWSTYASRIQSIPNS